MEYMIGYLGLLFGIIGFTKANKLEKEVKDLKKQININKKEDEKNE